MKQLNEYKHNLAGKEIIYDNANWTRQGKWYQEIYKVNDDGSVQHVRTQKYWTNVAGESKPANGETFIPECNGESIYINGTRCKLPSDARFEELPEHTCSEPFAHTYTYEVEGKTYEERYFGSISKAKAKWEGFITSFPQYTFDLLSVERRA